VAGAGLFFNLIMGLCEVLGIFVDVLVTWGDVDELFIWEGLFGFWRRGWRFSYQGGGEWGRR